jgi:hypothetical protein
LIDFEGIKVVDKSTDIAEGKTMNNLNSSL